jgi:phenylacetate-coenzyme A ligase PaaK-like adenylate-forming protein
LDRRLCVNERPLYEAQIAAVLAQTRAAGRPFRLEVLDRHIVAAIEMAEDLFADTVWFVESLKREIESEFQTRLGIEAEVRFVTARHQGAPRRKN